VSPTVRFASIVMLLSAGCAAALKEPPPISALQHDAIGTTSANALLQEASEEYDKRPDAAAVRRAEGLCLKAAQADEAGTDGLVCSIRAKAWLAEREKDASARTDLAVSAVQAGQWCLRRDPGSPACKFWLGVALGLQARDRPVTAEDGLKRMAQLLRDVVKDAPLLDEAGPERVLSLLLARAPGWPIGPGDVEEALVLARKAVELRPDYPPNQVALGEALLKNDDRAKALEALARAIDLAGRGTFASDPDAPSWIASARALQQR
jgi:tetratricopeptide (TPR) repeat protein